MAPDGRLHHPLAAPPVRGEDAEDPGGKQALGAGFGCIGSQLRRDSYARIRRRRIHLAINVTLRFDTFLIHDGDGFQSGYAVREWLSHDDHDFIQRTASGTPLRFIFMWLHGL